ncbi:hypothetical protein NMY22_g19890 [Coprinellus aureogranulatus]|nr:hypothetical protein NMY22_g19890 [Coprinellus aureogranulatus]
MRQTQSRIHLPPATTPDIDTSGLACPAKSTLRRLKATPEEQADRDHRMASAVRELLACIGEDPKCEVARGLGVATVVMEARYISTLCGGR